MIILASGSPARIKLLKEAGVAFQQRDHHTNERDLPVLAKPSDAALHLARSKALSLTEICHGNVVIGSDQVLEFDGEIFSKVSSLDELRIQLCRLRGKSHFLHSAVVCVEERAITFSAVSSATLTMRSFSEAFLQDYVVRHGADVIGCVGGYKIEAEGLQLFDAVVGDFFTIQGMPLLPLLGFLRSRGLLPS